MQIFSPKITCCNHFLGSSTEVLIPLSISGELYIRTNCIIFYGRNKKVSNKKLLESKLICNEIKKAKYYYLCFLHHRHSYFVILDNGKSIHIVSIYTYIKIVSWVTKVLRKGKLSSNSLMKRSHIYLYVEHRFSLDILFWTLAFLVWHRNFVLTCHTTMLLLLATK